jgi:phospholipase C
MSNSNRREFLRLAAGSATLALLPASIRRALAVPAAVERGTIEDVKHVVILMQENRSFDHYFGSLRGVRGFGDRFPVPLESGKPVWAQSDGAREIAPYHLDSRSMNALLVPDTPHSYADAQAAWNQGKFGHWPKYKTQYSMGHYRRDDIPFQFALADAFTLCDAYHCSITAGTDPNRIVFWSGSSFDPGLRQRGINSTDTDSEPDNLRCWVTGTMPQPGYTYKANALTWPTIPDVLQAAGISWRIYQDPNDNWTGAMHGGLAFDSFRKAQPGSALYEQGMSLWTLDDLRRQVEDGSLPQVSWILPTRMQSEHPGAPSSPQQGGNFTAQVLDALTANPEIWSRSVLFLTFDENDGFFDHLPPPAVPSYDADGALAGAATLDLAGHYFHDRKRAHLRDDDTISGLLRPWGLGPRVPMYVISPWSRGGWVDSQVADHTSVGRFLETRFGVRIPAISPWHRAVCGDLTTAFDFARPNAQAFPALPDMRGFAAIEQQQRKLPDPLPPERAQVLFQETGTRPSRALAYALEVDTRIDGDFVEFSFINRGAQGAVFHVYDRTHLERIPRRYTVEAGKQLSGRWDVGDGCHLWVYGPNGFVRSLRREAGARRDFEVRARAGADGGLRLSIFNRGTRPLDLSLRDPTYGSGGPWPVNVAAAAQHEQSWSLHDSGQWYDLIVHADGVEQRFAGRVETGRHGVSDPALGRSPAE